MEHKKLKFFSHISRLHNGFIFVPSFRGPPRGPGPRAPKLLKMALGPAMAIFRFPQTEIQLVTAIMYQMFMSGVHSMYCPEFISSD